MRTLNLHSLALGHLSCKSYHNEESTGKISIVGGDSLETLEGRNVLIVEVRLLLTPHGTAAMHLAPLTLLYATSQDMIDTGKTMVKLVDTLLEYKPADLKVAR